MPAPELIGDFIHIRVKDPDLFIDDSFRTIDISIEKGIKAVIGKLKSDPTGSTIVQKYIFDKNKWTVDTATAWVEEHKEFESTRQKSIRAKIVNIDEKEKTIKAIVSNSELDRDNEIIPTSSWTKRINYYLEHPVLASCHDYRDLRKQIGQAIDLQFQQDGLCITFKYYAGEGNAEADWAWVLASKGMAMFSVGFKCYELLTNEKIPIEYQKFNPNAVLIDNELLEVSQVIIGSNRGALQLSISNPTPEQNKYMYDVMNVCKGKIKIPDFEDLKLVTVKDIISAKTIPIKKDIPPVITETKPEPVKITASNLIPVDDLKTYIELREIIKSGRVISRKNREMIQDCIDNLTETISVLQQLMDMTEGDTDDNSIGDINVKHILDRIAELKRHK